MPRCCYYGRYHGRRCSVAADAAAAAAGAAAVAAGGAALWRIWWLKFNYY